MKSGEVQEFQKLTVEEKIDFFVRCQELLIKYHPDSEFIFRKRNLKEKKAFALAFIHKYKGFAYFDDNVCVLFNKIHVDDPKNPVKALKDHLYQEPKEKHNALSIDFVVFRNLEDCIGFCKHQYNPKIENILFVKNNQIKLYPTSKLLQRLGNEINLKIENNF